MRSLIFGVEDSVSQVCLKFQPLAQLFTFVNLLSYSMFDLEYWHAPQFLILHLFSWPHKGKEKTVKETAFFSIQIHLPPFLLSFQGPPDLAAISQFYLSIPSLIRLNPTSSGSQQKAGTQLFIVLIKSTHIEREENKYFLLFLANRTTNGIQWIDSFGCDIFWDCELI